jgi:hypothetical protein
VHESSKLVKTEELLNLLLLHIPLKQCAERLNLSYFTIRKYASEVEFLDRLRELSSSIYAEVVQDMKTERKTLSERLTEASDKALTKLEELLQNSQQEGIVLKAADSILDRTLETARNRKIEGNVQGHVSFDPVLLMHAAATAREIDSPTDRPSPSPPKKLEASFEQDGSQPSE